MEDLTGSTTHKDKGSFYNSIIDGSKGFLICARNTKIQFEYCRKRNNVILVVVLGDGAVKTVYHKSVSLWR